MSELPKSWEVISLFDIVLDPKRDLVDGPFGSNLKSSEYIESGVPVFKIQNIKANKFVDKKISYISPEKANELSRHSFSSGDLIITKLGDPLGLCCKVPEKYNYGIIVADLMRLRPASIINTNYLVYLINSQVVQSQFQNITKGTTRSRVNLSIVRDIRIPLPSFSEQHRIVTKIEELLSKLDKGLESLKTAQEQLKIYHQAVLKWVFEGKLTNAILREGELPSGWCIKKLGNVSEVSGGITQNIKREKLELKFPLLRVANVYFNKLDLNEIHYIGVEKNEIARVKLIENDLLFVEGNGSIEQIGRVALWNGSIQNCVHQNHLIKARFNKNIYPKYPLYYFCSKTGREKIKEQATSTSGLHTLSISKIKSLSLPFPSILEQTRIVAEIESRLSVCDKLEESITQSLQQAEALRQSILKKAFEGKLVPQDPNDEPASLLLERIRAERATTAVKNATPRTRGRPARKQS